MKRIRLLLVLPLLLLGCSKPIDSSRTIIQEGVCYRLTEKGVDPEPFTGEVTQHYLNGQLKRHEAYVEGKKNGTHLSYYDNGQLFTQSVWIEGQKSGLWESYHGNGQLWKKGNYENGKKSGQWEWFNGDGRLIEIHLYDQGQLIEKESILVEESDGKEPPVAEEKEPLLAEEKELPSAGE